MPRTIWTEDDRIALRAHYPTRGAQYCATLLDKTIFAICTKARRLGLKSEARCAQHIHMDRVRTPVFAYVLGFLWADAHISSTSYAISMNLTEKDALAISPFMCYTGDWRYHRRHINGKTYGDYRVNDKRFWTLLRSLGYGDKSARAFDQVCSYLGSDLIAPFLHGYFDGDGSIVEFNSGRYAITFAGHHDYDWSYFRGLLKDNGIQTTMGISHQEGHRGSALGIHTRVGIIRFYRLYLSGGPWGLSRKRERLQTFANMMREKATARRAIEVSGDKYVPRVTVGGKTVRVGRFKTIAEAEEAMDKWDEQNQSERYRLRRELALLDTQESSIRIAAAAPS